MLNKLLEKAKSGAELSCEDALKMRMEYFEMDCSCKGKYLDRMLQPSILMVLYRENLHGFTLIQKIGEGSMFDGTIPDKAGVYRYLKKMEGSGLLKSEWEFNEDGGKPRRIYAITDRGKHCLINWYSALNDYANSIGRLLKEYEEVFIGNNDGCLRVCHDGMRRK